MQKSQANSLKLHFSTCIWARLCLLSVILMILFGFLWEVKLYPLREGSLLWLKVLPLILLLPGLFQGRLRSLQWLTLIIWFFITEAIVRVTSDPAENFVWSCIWLGLAVTTLISAMAAVRKIRLSKLHRQKIV